MEHSRRLSNEAQNMSGGFKRWLTHDPDDRPAERGFVRLFVPVAFIASGVAAGVISHRTETAPGIAFNNHLIYAGLLFLLIFYALLLLALPLVRAVFAGELPTELTTEGPRYPEKELASSRVAAEALGKRIDAVQERLKGSIEETAADAALGIEELEEELASQREELRKLLAERRKRRFTRLR
jgi:hypothetical protein